MGLVQPISAPAAGSANAFRERARTLAEVLIAVGIEVGDLAHADLEHATALRRHLGRAAWLVNEAGRLLEEAAAWSHRADASPTEPAQEP